MSFSLDELGGGGGNSWLPENVGDKISGTIIKIERTQATDFTTGAPAEWSDGKPKLVTIVELQTDLDEKDEDDGKRTVWLKGGANYEAAEGKGLSGELALKQAGTDAGVTAFDEGGKLVVIMSGVAKATQRGYRQAKLYQAKYEAPKSSMSVDDLEF